MIAYHLLCHANFRQVALQLDALYSEEDSFLIDVDDGQSPDISPLAKFIDRPNVHLIRDANIGWGGAGTLRKTLSGAVKLLSLDSRWRYYIVLSGQDLPLKSNGYIKEQLRAGDQLQQNFIRWEEPPVLSVDNVPRINALKKITQWGDRGHTRVYVKPGAVNPQAEFGARWLVDVVEVGEKGEVYIGQCDEWLLAQRYHFFQRTPYFCGANWFNLHRSLIEHMASDPFTSMLYTQLRNTFIPDESFFQTYIMNTSFRDTVCWDPSRLILRPGPKPRVKVFGMEDLSRLLAGDEWFGRKFDTNHDAQVVDAVLAQAA